MLPFQLFVYALMSQLRQEFNFETFVSRKCRSVLSNVFTVTSLSDVPVFEDTFCVDHPSQGQNLFNFFSAPRNRTL
jgi:hypothetical protein